MAQVTQERLRTSNDHKRCGAPGTDRMGSSAPNLGPRLGVRRLSLPAAMERGAILALEQSCRVPGTCVGRVTHQNWVVVSNVSLLCTGNEHLARTSFGRTVADSNSNPERKTDPSEKPGARTVLLLWTTLYGLCQRCVRITF